MLSNLPGDFTALVAADLSFLPGAIHLVAIHPERGPLRKKWFGDDRAAAEAWANAQNRAGYNIHYTVNVVSPGFNGKPAKDDIVAVRYFWVEIDPPIDEEKMRRALSLLPPTATMIWSGNGFHLLWTSEGASADECEEVNLRLVHAFGGDKNCWNLDRLLRVPGTINYPTAAKRKAGRTECLALLLEHRDDVSCSVATMLDALPAAPHEPRKADAADVTLGPYKPTPIDELKRKPSPGLLAMLTADQVPGERSEKCMAVAKRMLDEGYTRADVAGVMSCQDNPITAHVFDQRDWQRAAERIAIRAEGPPKPDDVFDPLEPLPAGASLVPLDTVRGLEVVSGDSRSLARSLATSWGSRLAHYQGEFFEWQDGAYVPLSEDTVRSHTWNHLETLAVRSQGGEIKRLSPRSNVVAGAIDALRGLKHIRPDQFPEPPFWLDGRDEPDAKSLLSTRTGLVDPATGEVLAATDELFTLNMIGCEYRPDAAAPERWLRFLGEVWPGEDGAECVTALRQFMGYLLTPDTRLQKALMMVGPKRSGKGTIIRVIQELVGKQNTVAPSLGSLGGDFGLQPLLGKLVALVSDARLDTRHGSAIAENLLRITGEDQVTVNRKNLSAMTVTLPVRFVLATNEVLRWSDREGALANRFIVLPMRQSFAGREDIGLSDTLRTELPSILNWAIDGLREVRTAGRIAQPSTGADVVRDMEYLASPVRGFIDARCHIAPEHSVEKARLFEAFRSWHRSMTGIEYTRGAEWFSRDIMTVISGAVTPGRGPREEGRPHIYVGIALKPDG